MTQSTLQKSLNTRIALQVSLSALSDLVEEWMDSEIDRWLESVPLPPELPAGETADFVVTLGSDLGRMKWAAHGDPAGFVPKMAEYFDTVGIDKEDVAVLNEIGEKLEPRRVGSWVSVHQKVVRTGWQFLDRHPWSAIEPLFGDHDARDRVTRWVDDCGVTMFQRFSQQVGGEPHTEIEWLLPGASVEERLEVAAAGFAELMEQELPDHAREAARAVGSEPTLVVRVTGGVVVKVALRVPGPGEDVVARLCRTAGTEYDGTIDKLIKTLSADGFEAVELIRAAGRTMVDVDCVPGSAPPEAPRDVD